MAISRIGTPAAADGTTITIPAGHQNGDLIVMYAFRTALVSPTLPAGWTGLQAVSAGATSFRTAWKLAKSAAETSGTWTNATGLVCVVYRGTSTIEIPVLASAQNTNTSSTITYGAINPIKTPGVAWVIAFGAIVSTTSTIETPPTDLTNFVNTVGATVEYSGHDSNGAYTAGQGKWPATTVAVGVSAEWRSATLQVIPESLGPIVNYQFVKAPDGISVTEKIR